MLNTTKKFPNEWRDIVYAFLERLSVVKTSVFSKLICLLLFTVTSCCMLSHFSHVWLFGTLWTVAWQAPLSMGFSRQEHWSGWPRHPPRDLPDLGVKPAFLKSHALAGGFFTTSTTRETLSRFSCVQLFATPWTVAYQAPLSMIIPRQEYWSGLPFPSPGDLPGLGIELIYRFTLLRNKLQHIF